MIAYLLDELTDNYKFFIDKQKPTTRAILWSTLQFGRPFTAAEVARACGMDVSKVSAYLARFVDYGWLIKVRPGKPFLFEPVDPFGYVICGRPGIEVFARFRRSPNRVLRELAEVPLQAMIPMIEGSTPAKFMADKKEE